VSLLAQVEVQAFRLESVVHRLHRITELVVEVLARLAIVEVPHPQHPVPHQLAAWQTRDFDHA
jgi:hypothetical protein